MRIGIVGCGTAGPAAALFLHRAGHDVVLMERARRLQPVGAGLLLQPTGRWVLERLGLRGDVESLGAPIRRLRGVTTLGRLVLDVHYDRLGPNVHGLGCHRGALFIALMEAVEAAGIELRTGVEAIGGKLGAGAVLVDRHAREHGPFDLLVVADGARSALRSQMAGHLVRRCRPYPYGAFWFMGEDAEGAFGDTLVQSYRGTDEMIGFLPSGRAARGGPRTVSMFWSVRMKDVASIKAAGLTAWKKHARSLSRAAGPLLAQIEHMDQLVAAGYLDVVMSRTWLTDESSGKAAPGGTGRAGGAGVVFLGDAAHAMSPQLGQGANLALLDAAALADALSVDRPLRRSLRAYERTRLGGTRYYQFSSRWLTPVFQSDHVWLGPVRDAFFDLLCKAPGMRTWVVQSLAGVRRGFLPWQVDTVTEHAPRQGVNRSAR